MRAGVVQLSLHGNGLNLFVQQERAVQLAGQAAGDDFGQIGLFAGEVARPSAEEPQRAQRHGGA